MPGHCKNCEDVRKLFQIPLLTSILLDAIGDNDVAIVQNNEPLKYVIRKVAPRADINIFDKPENVRCLRYILKKRRRRHATYVSLRHKGKKRGHVFRRKVDPADIPSSDQYQNIINFIVRNKTFDETYTFVPIVFATVNPGLLSTQINVVTNTQSSEIISSKNTECANSQSSGIKTSQNTEFSNTQTSGVINSQHITVSGAAANTIPAICTNLINNGQHTSSTNNPVFSSTENSSKCDEESTVLQSLNNLAANSSNDMLFRVTGFNSSGESAIENNDLTTNKDLLAAKSIANELSDKVSQLKSNFSEMLKMDQRGRSKKFISTLIPNDNDLANFELSSNCTINPSTTLQTLNSSTPAQGPNITIPEICLSFISHNGSTTTSTMSTLNPLCSVSTNSDLSSGSLSTIHNSGSERFIENNTTVISSTESLQHISVSKASANASTVAANNSNMFPGILIYPKTKTEKKRLAADFSINEPDNFISNKFDGKLDDAENLKQASFNKVSIDLKFIMILKYYFKIFLIFNCFSI